MTPDPDVVVTHEAPHQATPAGIGAAIRDRVPAVDPAVADVFAEHYATFTEAPDDFRRRHAPAHE